MAFFDKLKFWKHKEDLDIGKDLGKSFGKEPDINIPDFGKSPMDIPSEDFGKPISTTQHGRLPFPEQEVRHTPVVPQPQWQGYKEDSEMQVISAKLDALKASLDSINQRLMNLERIAEGEQPRRWQYR